MESSTSVERPRKRRAINACIACRTSKVRCDGRQPCARCDRNDAVCQYRSHDVTVPDPIISTTRIERLEAEVEHLKSLLHDLTPRQVQRDPQSAATGIRTQHDRSETRGLMNTRPHLEANAVEKGVVSYDDAFAWFASFFAGSHYLVPIFSDSNDGITSVASRSAFLFDAIVSVGCRAEQGFNSPTFRQLQSGLREHLTSLLITCEQPSLEAVQAITLMAAYSENGYMLISLALRFAAQLGLHKATDQLLAMHHNQDLPGTEERELYRLQRVWHGICNLELL
jgi:hypothetical protein